MKRLFSSLLLFCLLTLKPLFGDLTAYGYSQYEEVAKRKALENLAKKIEILAKNRGYDKFVFSLDKLPILKPKYSIRNKTNGYEAKITLDRSCLPGYNKAIRDIQKDATYLSDTLEHLEEGMLRKKMLEELHSLYTMLDRYHALLNLVFHQQNRFHTNEKKRMQKELFSHKTDVDSRSYAIDLQSGYFKQQRTFVYPLTLFGSQTPSDYGIEFAKEFSEAINPTNDIDLAKYLLVGRYGFQGEKVLLQLALLEKKNYNIVRIKTLLFKDKKRQKRRMFPDNFKIEPYLFSDFDKNDFDLYVKSEKGSSDLIFEEKKRAKFYLRSAKKGYLHVIGYYSFPNKTIVYLAQLNNKKGKAKFIKQIKGTKGYVKIADFEVLPPFATRSYQLFVTEKQPLLPQTTYNKKYRVYEIKTDDYINFAAKSKDAFFTEKGVQKVAYSAISFVTLKAEK